MRKVRRSKKLYEEFVCSSCFRQLNQCVCKLYPPRNLIHIDRAIQESIRILNQKGYRTGFCCESHWDEYSDAFTEIYISFHVPDSILQFDSLPEGFKKDKGRCTIRYWYSKNLEKEEFEQEKQHHLNCLQSWADDLPVFYEPAARERAYQQRKMQREQKRQQKIEQADNNNVRLEP